MQRTLCLFAMGLGLMSGCASTPGDVVPAGTSEGDLLRRLVDRNEAARRRLTGYAYHVQTQFKADIRDDRPIYHGVGEVRVRGDELWSVYRQTILNISTQKMEEIEKRLVVNRGYVASWPMKGDPVAFRYDHASIDRMDERVATRVKVSTPPEVLPYAFGDTVLSLRESMRLQPVRWDATPVTRDDGATTYLVRRFLPTMNDPRQPDNTWEVDPTKGYLVVASTSYKPDGRVWIEQKLDVREVAPGFWFPVALDETFRGPTRDDPVDEVTRWQKATLTGVRINPDFTPDQFQIDALNLRQDMPRVTVVRVDRYGQRATYRYVGDELILQDVARVEDQ
ncbi:MAG: hypothetical protein ACYTGQ_04100 [Planctomycetota bacterium]|jgi:hypothetical protein